MRKIVKTLNIYLVLTSLLLIISVLIAGCGPAGKGSESTDNAATNENSEQDDSNNQDISAGSGGETGQTEVTEITPTASSDSELIAVDDDTADNPYALEIDPDSIETDASGVTVGFTKDGQPFRGDPTAAIVIYEYSDYQCPFCSRFYDETLPTLDENYFLTGEAVLVYFDFPLNNIHPQAAAAANAARCAGEQSAAAYWQMHDALFGNPQEWSNQDAAGTFVAFAKEIGLDLETFQACVDDNKYQEEVSANLASGAALGVSGTPSFFINGQSLVGAQPLAVFDEAISTVRAGGRLASNEPQTEPAVAPTPAAFTENYAGAKGDPDAPVTIVEFTDYQCPYCSQHSIQTMPAIFNQLVETGRVYYILKDMPLDQLHPNARAAAAAARCAGDQDAYWSMHDTVFAQQSEWASAGDEITGIFVGYAALLDLDEDEFETCLSSGKFDDAVENNFREGQSLGVSGTPFFFVDGYPLNGARPYEHFELAVQLAEEGRLAEIYAPRTEPEQPPQPTGPVDVPTDNSYSIGDPDAPVTIVEYTDFQCPFCVRHFQQTFPQIVENYVNEGLVRYVFKDFPLNSIHPQAAKAAEAARCAGDQGEFLEMHDRIFERQQQWSGTDPIEIFIGYAEEIGLDGDIFGECLESGMFETAVNADLQEGINFGVAGTPHFFLNGYPVSGAQPYSLFEQAIEQLLTEVEGQ